MKIIPCIPLLAASAHAATYTVKSGGGGNYSTVQACANAIGNGDTCLVYAGTYNEHVTLSAGGIGAYKTLQVNGTDLVYVYDFTINSHNKIIGFSIQNPSSPYGHDCVGIANGATDIYITNNNFYACGYHAMISGVASSATSSYVYIQGNTLSYPCTTSTIHDECPGMQINGDHILVENNDISHTSDGIYVNRSHNVIRKNTFHDNTTSDCVPGGLAGVCHIDFIQAEPSVATQYNLYEGNTILNNLGANAHVFIDQADVCAGQCFGLIIRFNVAAHIGESGSIDDNAGDSVDPGWSYLKSYNNTWVDIANYPPAQPYGATNSFTRNSTYSSEINDLFYYPQSMTSYNPYMADSSTIGTFTVKNNLAWCAGSPCNLHGSVYGSGLFTDVAGNRVADPQFVNYSGNDFHLQAGSPAIGAGTYLATVSGGDSGSGTSLVVNDASYFQDGYGITGVNGDCIAVTTVTNHVCVTAVNYQTNTLTLASSITRSAGDPVWLYSDSTGRIVLIGTAPNIGATFVSVPIVAPPASLTAVAR
jgi:parallel beta-helix repeat protein